MLPAASAATFSTPALSTTRAIRASNGLRSRCGLPVVAQNVLAIAAAAFATTPALTPPIAPVITTSEWWGRCCFGLAARTGAAPAAALFRPGNGLVYNPVAGTIAVIAIAASTAMFTIMAATPAAMLAIPFMAATRPIAAMMIAHMIAGTTIVEDVIAITRIPVAVIPATTEADVIEAVAAIAGIIAVKRGIGIAIILVIGIAIVIIAKSHIVDAA